MNDKYMEQAVIEFAKTGKRDIEKNFTLQDKGYTVIIKKNSQVLIEESNLYSNVNTISTLPSGNSCGCCGGSGRS